MIDNVTKLQVKKEVGGKNVAQQKQAKNNNQAQQTNIALTKFKGNTEELHGAIYDVGGYYQLDLYTTTQQTKKTLHVPI